MKVLVCGSRIFKDYATLNEALLEIHDKHKIDLIIQGGARGADDLGMKWAILQGIDFIQFDAEWNRYGKAAGHIRNKKMLDEGEPDLVVAFPLNGDLAASKGTKNMVNQARAAGVEVIVVGE